MHVFLVMCNDIGSYFDFYSPQSGALPAKEPTKVTAQAATLLDLIATN